tara:strand:- start:1529 stop:1678 length:150 start_codon:yes stop_codon:yes gene_type:complete
MYKDVAIGYRVIPNQTPAIRIMQGLTISQYKKLFFTKKYNLIFNHNIGH